MSYLWDVYILCPILFVIMFIGIFFMIFKEFKHRQQWLLIGYTFFWFFAVAISFLGSLGMNMDFYVSVDSEGTNPLLLFWMSSLLYASVFAVLLHWISDRIKNRKVVSQTAMVANFAGAIFIISSHSGWSAIVAAIMIGFAVGSLPLTIMAFNETIKHRIRPFGTMRTIFLLSGLAIFGAIMLILISFNASSDSDAGLSTWTVSSLDLTEIMTAIMTIVGFVLSFFVKEGSERLMKFNDFELKLFKPYNWKSVSLLFVLLFVLVADFSLSQGPLASLLVCQRLYESDANALANIYLYRRLFHLVFIIAFVISSLLSWWLVLKHMEIKYSLGICIVLWFAYFVFAAFNHSATAFIVMQLLNGFAAGILLQIILSIILAWNYRSRKIPVFGLAFGLTCLIIFINYFVTNWMEMEKVGIFSLYNINIPFIDAAGYAKIVDDVTTIIFTVLATTMLLILCTIYYLSEFLFAEYASPALLASKIDRLVKIAFINTDNILNVNDTKAKRNYQRILWHKNKKPDLNDETSKKDEDDLSDAKPKLTKVKKKSKT